MNKYEKAAIIGYWRSGATLMEIAGLTRIEEWVIENVIIDYQIKLEN